ncbi:39S ribosomal protein S30, mitochondrial [Eurytemora carolleeae]|uniref:39S ribosomal protein S30, mitochondrial n=1 Tax=Eurytemora carolleeae TaxID=1294199 RepID=UPI000C7741AB|nr:39S ribosomal protein S30, mitochondrial [Eurytemora carolleeae]|eukprot:XP_023334071.1 39S ribosomal protein S30, mitochondrial-like [Eurytemora affinis]
MIRALSSSSSTVLRRTDFRLQAFRLLHGPQRVDEYSETAMYPPISRYRTDDEKSAAKARDLVRECDTVEEKMYQINRPKYYGWWSYIMQPDKIPADLLDFTKFSTWTHVEQGLPEYFHNQVLDTQAKSILAEVAPLIEMVVRDESQFREIGKYVTNDKIRFSEKFANTADSWAAYTKENIFSRNLVKKIHEVLYSHLSSSHPHIRDSVEDYDARNEAFWFRGGIQPDKSMLKKREGTKKMLDKHRARVSYQVKEFGDEKVKEPYERALQIKHNSVVQVRHENPLSEFVSRDSALCTNISVPIVDYDPRCYGLRTVCQHGTNIPGYWPEEPNQMGLFSYHTRVNVFNHKSLGGHKVITEEVEREQDISKGILTNFAWCLPQACYLGFSPLTDLTFPLVSQSMNTDGRKWSYFAYQMNTCDLSHNNMSDHTHQNILWSADPVLLYDKVEDGKVFNYNPDSLLPLIKMFLNKPRSREYSMTPYLGKIGKLVNHPDNYQRKRFMEIIRNQFSNRPKTVQKPEMYLWEKLLLVDNKSMPQLALDRRRPWWHMKNIDFLGKEHWHPEFVNTDEKRHKYIAKGMREPWTRKGELNRRYNKFQPKIAFPLKEKLAVYEVPESKYKGEKDDA